MIERLVAASRAAVWIARRDDSLDRRNRAPITIDESLEKQSGTLPRRNEASAPSWADPAPVSVTTRLPSRHEREASSRTVDWSGVHTREPGFVEDEPEDGVPTPRPKLPLSCVPRRVVDERTLLTLPLDHRAGFVLAHIDGATDIRTLIDVCGLPQDELVALIEQLRVLHAIEL
ncbi:MAG: hypothetical protein BGO98_07550 [Myxococcales bacterium 68-20]|nr:MAG: hypothetical protein BGO98_07550 [Myxococcales bacterium 68-20]